MDLREVPTPAYGPSDALIRVHAAGVCGTDLHIWEWDAWASNRLKPPVVIGHEFAGVIAALGARGRGGGPARGRGQGHGGGPHRLRSLPPMPHRTRPSLQPHPIIGVDRDGAFADYIAMPASNVMKLDGIPMDVGAIMDPIGNAVHTVLEGGRRARQHRVRARLRPDRVLRLRRRARPPAPRW
jgi:threonine 3-dehydrogenase